MTRRVTIVNTSNWDGEDWLVRTHVKGKPDSCVRTCKIKPGGYFNFDPTFEEFHIEAVDSKTPEPFYCNGVQIMPQVICGIGRIDRVI